MPKKPVSLSVHKNTVEKRRKQELAREMASWCKGITRSADVRAFAVVTIDAEGRSHCMWDTGAIMPLWAFPESVCAMLRRDMEESGVDEDWKPSISQAPTLARGPQKNSTRGK